FLQNPTIAKVTPANAGDYIFTSGTAHSTNCIVQTTVIISPTFSATIAGADTVCPNSTNSFSGAAGMDSYTWTVEGGAKIVGSSTNQTVNVVAAGGCNTNFAVKLTAFSGACSSTVTQAVTVIDSPVITSFPPD